MRHIRLVLISLLFLLYKPCQASDIALNMGEIRISDTTDFSLPFIHHFAERKRPSPLLKIFRIKQKKDKKIVAALLAFPFPFGIVGLHRIYLGCAPYIPVAYIASLGGIFGILPFVDCCVLLIEKDLDKYINSKKIFMWVN